MKASLSLSIAVVIATCLLASPTVSATDVGGLICSNTTWDLAGSPYVVTVAAGSVLIACDATLTIDPGVVVQFEDCLAITVGHVTFGAGSLVARGTLANPITFTSINPPPADPGNPQPGEAQPGDWTRIHFTDYSVDATYLPNLPGTYGTYDGGCILEHVIVEYAGCGTWPAVFAEKSAPFLNYCEVRHNAYYGIQVDGTGAPHINIENCHVWDHPQRGIYISAGSEHRLVDNDIHDNAGGIFIYNAPLNTLSGNSVDENTASDCGGGIYFYSSSTNTLIGNTLTGNTASNAGGAISFRYFSGGNMLTGNTLTGNTASASGWCIRGGGIYFEGSSGNTLTGNTLTGNTANCYGGGICFESSGYNTLTGNTVTGNTAYSNGGGIYFNFLGGSGINTLTGNTLTGNTGNAGGGIYFGSGGNNTLAGNVLTDNTAINEGGALYCNNSDNLTLSDNRICRNHTLAGLTGGIYVTNGSEWLSLRGDSSTRQHNMICCNDGYDFYNNNAYDGSGKHDIDARWVQWGTNDTTEIQDRIHDYFDDGSLAFVVWYPYVDKSDLDFDGDCDGQDFLTFSVCYNGSLNPPQPQCQNPCAADLDGDSDVDGQDFLTFSTCYNGSLNPPRCPE